MGPLRQVVHVADDQHRGVQALAGLHVLELELADGADWNDGAEDDVALCQTATDRAIPVDVLKWDIRETEVVGAGQAIGFERAGNGVDLFSLQFVPVWIRALA